jgi:hypothetical protein
MRPTILSFLAGLALAASLSAQMVVITNAEIHTMAGDDQERLPGDRERQDP